MKRWLLVSIIGLMVVGTGPLNAQEADTLLFEDFDTAWLPPGWSWHGNVYWGSYQTWNVFASTWYPDMFVYSSPYGADCWWSYSPTNEWLITPELDLTDYGAADLTLRVAVFIYYGNASNTDRIEISTDGGVTWTQLVELRSYLESTMGSGYDWYTVHDPPVSFDLTPWIGQSITLAFHYYWTSSMIYPRGVYDIEDVLVTAVKRPTIGVGDHRPPPILGVGCKYTPAVEILNRSEEDDIGPITLVNHIQPGGYSSTRSIPILSPQQRTWVTFDEWTAPSETATVYDTIIVTFDSTTKIFTWEHSVRAEVNPGKFEPIVPTPDDTVYVDSTYFPRVFIYGTGCGFPVKCTCWVSDQATMPNVIYIAEQDEFFMQPKKEVIFDSLSFPAPGIYILRVVARDPWYVPPPESLSTEKEDTLTWAVEAKVAGILDVGTDAIAMPPEIHPDESVFPKAAVHNYGQIPTGSGVECKIEPGNYKDTTEVTGLEPGNTREVEFKEWIPAEAGDYTVTVTTLLDDADSENNSKDTTVSVTSEPGIADEPVLGGFDLSCIRPNPMSSQTVISYQLPVNSEVSLAIYDISGKLIQTLVAGAKEAGSYTAIWDGRNDKGKNVPAGLYFVKLLTPEYKTTRKVILLTR